MSKILSIGTAVPAYKHRQEDILDFMQLVYAPGEADKRKLKFLYHKGGIDTRYSVIPDYSLPAAQWQFYPPSENLEPFPSLELRMKWYQQYAAPLSMQAIAQCVENFSDKQITHLITVSCTGMSAPGLDLELLELLKLPPEERDVYLAIAAADAEELYRNDKELTGFDAFSEELDDDDEPDEG